MFLWSAPYIKLLILWMHKKPADSRLAIGWSLGNTQCLAHLSLRQAKGEATDLELFGELSHFIKVDSIDHHTIVRSTADCIFIHTYTDIHSVLFHQPSSLRLVHHGQYASGIIKAGFHRLDAFPVTHQQHKGTKGKHRHIVCTKKYHSEHFQD